VGGLIIDHENSHAAGLAANTIPGEKAHEMGLYQGFRAGLRTSNERILSLLKAAGEVFL
jgi:hypothetical protein